MGDNQEAISMTLQHVLYPSVDTCTEERLYFRRSEQVQYRWGQKYIDIGQYGTVQFDTYFNGFSAEKWMKYTTIRNVCLKLKLRGCASVTLMRKEKQGGEIYTEYLGEYLCDGRLDEEKEYRFMFRSSAPTGMLCFSIMAVKSCVRFYSAEYDTLSEGEKRNPIKLAIAICTYKRERFVEENLQLLKDRYLDNMESPMYGKLEIFVSDNAGTLDQDRLGGENIHIFKNRNAGGAGGFTRGLIEAYRQKQKKGITHILLMDDDVRIEPESVFRTCMLLSCLKEEYRDAFVGGAMLRLDRQYIQVESGAVWNGGELISLKHGLDLRDLDACLYNEFEERAQFNAWWYCAFPIDVVQEDNLPMPIFIRGDDVEYGLRNMKHLILMNGICVWHEPFENKYSSFLYYYILRNRLIDNALHGMTLSKKRFLEILRTQVGDEVRLYRYRNAHLLMQGVEDFLKGVSWLEKQDGEQLHRKVTEEGYRLQYLEELEEGIQFLYPLYETSLADMPRGTFLQRIVNHYTINGTFLPPKRYYSIIPTVGPCQTSVYRTVVVLNYDYASRKGFVTKRDPKEAKACMKRLRRLNDKILAEYDRAVQDYEKNYRRVTSLEFWKGYLGI